MVERPRQQVDTDSLLARMGKDRFVLGFVSDHLASMPPTVRAAARELAKALERIGTTHSEVTASLAEGVSHVKTFQESTEKLGEQADLTFERLEGVGDSLKRALDDAAELIRAVGHFEKPNAEAASRTSALEHTTDGVRSEVARLVDLAEQVNLLALNSVIEADHTGREGRPFARLAQEIRSVAARTAEEARQVQQIVEKIESEVREATGRVGTSEQHHREGALKAGELSPELTALETGLEQLRTGEEDFRRQFRAMADHLQDVRTRYEQMAAVAERTGMTVDSVLAALREEQEGLAALGEDLEEVLLAVETHRASSGPEASRRAYDVVRTKLVSASQLLSVSFASGRELSSGLDNCGRLASDQSSSASLAQRKTERLEVLADALAERAQFVMDRGRELLEAWERRVKARVLALIGHIDTTAERTHEAVEAMGALEGRIRTIDVVAASIARLVLKIDMLAVSGSIEALKAGTQGGGFGAVAAQVCQLAAESTRVADRIRLSSFNLQSAVSVIGRSLDEAEGTARTEHARSARARENLQALETSLRGLGAEFEAVERTTSGTASQAVVLLKDAGILVRAAEAATSGIEAAARAVGTSAASLSAVARGVEKVSGRLES